MKNFKLRTGQVARLKETTVKYSKNFKSETLKCRSPFKMPRYKSVSNISKLVLDN